MSGEDQQVGGSCAGHVQQAPVLGSLHAVVQPLPPGIASRVLPVTVLITHSAHDPEFRVVQDVRGPSSSPDGTTKVSHTHHRELQPLGGVDRHQLHCPALWGPAGRFAFARFPGFQVLHLAEEFRQAHPAVLAGKFDEFPHIVQLPAALSFGQRQGDLEGGQVQRIPDQPPDVHPAALPPELDEHLGCPGDPLWLVGDWRIGQRMRIADWLRAPPTARRMPAQAVQALVAQVEQRRPQRGSQA